MISSSIHRRGVLRGAAWSVTLPMLQSVRSASAGENTDGSSVTGAAAEEAEAIPAQRLVCIGSNLGLYRKALYPEDTGPDHGETPLLNPLRSWKDRLTVFSGLDHRAGNGHNNWDNFLCGKRIGSVSFDQIIARHLLESHPDGGHRFDSIQLCAGDIPRQRMVYNHQGVPRPMINRPSVIYQKLFVTDGNRRRVESWLAEGNSSLDAVAEQARDLQRRVGVEDRQTLDQYFESLRSVERRMRQSLTVRDRHPNLPPPPAADPIAPTMMLQCEAMMLDIIAMALQTDATPVATLFIAGLGQVFTLDGETLRAGYHALSHHGNDPDLIRDLIRVEQEHMRCLDRFASKLRECKDHRGRPLLDSTVVMFGTGMGDASRHSNRDLPTIVLGGGLRAGGHRAFDPQDDRTQLGNVFVSIGHQLGLPSDQFSEAVGGVEGLATA